MRRLFVDTFYLVALLYRRDAWHDRVAAFSHTLTPDDALLTTDAILVEFLAALSGRGEHLRLCVYPSYRYDSILSNVIQSNSMRFISSDIFMRLQQCQ